MKIGQPFLQKQPVREQCLLDANPLEDAANLREVAAQEWFAARIDNMLQTKLEKFPRQLLDLAESQLLRQGMAIRAGDALEVAPFGDVENHNRQ